MSFLIDGTKEVFYPFISSIRCTTCYKGVIGNLLFGKWVVLSTAMPVQRINAISCRATTRDCPYKPSCNVGAILYGCPLILYGCPLILYGCPLINKISQLLIYYFNLMALTLPVEKV